MKNNHQWYPTTCHVLLADTVVAVVVVASWYCCTGRFVVVVVVGEAGEVVDARTREVHHLDTGRSLAKVVAVRAAWKVRRAQKQADRRGRLPREVQVPAAEEACEDGGDHHSVVVPTNILLPLTAAEDNQEVAVHPRHYFRHSRLDTAVAAVAVAAVDCRDAWGRGVSCHFDWGRCLLLVLVAVLLPHAPQQRHICCCSLSVSSTSSAMPTPISTRL